MAEQCRFRALIPAIRQPLRVVYLQASWWHSVGSDECHRDVCKHNSQRLANGRVIRPCATTVCGTADGTMDGTRRSTVGTLNMGTRAGTGESLAWDIA